MTRTKTTCKVYGMILLTITQNLGNGITRTMNTRPLFPLLDKKKRPWDEARSQVDRCQCSPNFGCGFGETAVLDLQLLVTAPRCCCHSPAWWSWSMWLPLVPRYYSTASAYGNDGFTFVSRWPHIQSHFCARDRKHFRSREKRGPHTREPKKN